MMPAVAKACPKRNTIAVPARVGGILALGRRGLQAVSGILRSRPRCQHVEHDVLRMDHALPAIFDLGRHTGGRSEPAAADRLQAGLSASLGLG
jgi:hypothetical protein